MNLRLPACALGLVLAVLPAIAQTAPTAITTTKRSAVTIGGGSFALAKGTKLEVLGREGDKLIVKFHAAQGKIPLADTDYPADAAPTEPAPEPATSVVQAVPTPAAPANNVAPAKAATPPALNASGQGPQPTTHYGKAVQKARQAAETNKATHVDPTKGIMDDAKK